MHYCESSSEFHICSLASGVGDINVLLTAKKCLAVFGDFTIKQVVDRNMLDSTEFYKEINVWMFKPKYHQKSYVAIKMIGTLFCNLDKKSYAYVERNKKDVSDMLHYWETNRELASLACFNVSTDQTIDYVACIKCVDWPLEGKFWMNRNRCNGWPDNGTIEKIVSTGCHVVPERHRSGDMDDMTWRLSFSAAETILIRSWTTTQRIVYHMLRYFGDVAILNEAWGKKEKSLLNYQIKTLMLWACELKPSDWWNKNSCLHLYSYLLQQLKVWFENEKCPNYFIESINMFEEGMKRARYYEVVEKLNVVWNINQLSVWIQETYLHTGRRQRKQYFENFLGVDEELECLKTYARHRLEQTLAIKTLGGRHKSVCYKPKSHRNENRLYLALREKITQVEEDARWIYALLDLSWNHSSEEPEKWMLKTELSQKLSKQVCIITPTPHYSSSWYSMIGESLLKIGGSTVSCFPAVLLELCEELFERSLQTKDIFSESIHNRSSIYLAAIDFATKKYELSWTYCALVISNIKIAKITQLHTISIPSLLFIEDVSTIVGFAYLLKFQRTAKGVNMKRFSKEQLQTSLDFFAHYLAFTCQTFHLDMTKQDCSNSLRMRSEFPMENLLVHLWSYKYKKFLHRQQTITKFTKDDLKHDTIKFRYHAEAKKSMPIRKLSVECLQKLQSAMSLVDKILAHFQAVCQISQRQYHEDKNLCMLILYQEVRWNHEPIFGVRFKTMVYSRSNDFLEPIFGVGWRAKVYSRSIDFPCGVVLDNSVAFLDGLLRLIMLSGDYYRMQEDLKVYGQRNDHLRRRIYNLHSRVMRMPTKSTYYRKYEKLKMWQHLMGMRADQPH